MMNIFEHAHKIVIERNEEAERKNGPMKEGLERAALIASGACGKPITSKDVHLILVALKLSRLSYSDHYDHYLDAVAYLGALYENEIKSDDIEEAIEGTKSNRQNNEKLYGGPPDFGDLENNG